MTRGGFHELGICESKESVNIYTYIYIYRIMRSGPFTHLADMSHCMSPDRVALVHLFVAGSYVGLAIELNVELHHLLLETFVRVYADDAGDLKTINHPCVSGKETFGGCGFSVPDACFCMLP